MVFFYILNLLDYSTTVHALDCIPGAYETNKWLANPEDAFRVKILGFLSGFFTSSSGFSLRG